MFSLTSSRETDPGAIPPPPDYSLRSNQWKLMFVVAVVMTALMGARWLFPQETWIHLWGGQRFEPLKLEAAELADKTPDTRMPRTAPQDKTDIPGAFFMPLAATEPGDVTTEKPAEAEPAPVRPALPKLTDAQAKSIEDDAVYRAREQEAWFTLLQGLNQATPDEIAKASEGRVGFIQIYEQPTYYRGRIVSVRGRIREAKWVYAHENSYGIRGYFLCWLLPAGGPTSPIQIYLLDLPEDFPRGENIDEDVEIHGYFFKRVAYAAKDATRLAPVILAKSPVWTPPSARPRALPPNYPLLAAIGVLTLFVGVGLAWYMFQITPEPVPSHSPFAAGTTLSPEETEQNVRDSLDQLARRL